jgi:hypothetical protein
MHRSRGETSSRFVDFEQRGVGGRMVSRTASLGVVQARQKTARSFTRAIPDRIQEHQISSRASRRIDQIIFWTIGFHFAALCVSW